MFCRSIGKCGIVVTASDTASSVRWEKMIGINTGVAMAFGCQKFHNCAEEEKKQQQQNDYFNERTKYE